MGWPCSAPGCDARLLLQHTHGAIFTINPDGTGLFQVTHPGPGILTTEPEWSPDGEWIAYWNGDDDNGRMYKIQADGSHRTYLSGMCTGDCHSDIGPVFSPAGTHIAFSRKEGPGKCFNPCVIAINVMRRTGPRRTGSPSAMSPRPSAPSTGW
jgi:Tol biopolymer transport system component